MEQKEPFHTKERQKERQKVTFPLSSELGAEEKCSAGSAQMCFDNVYMEKLLKKFAGNEERKRKMKEKEPKRTEKQQKRKRTGKNREPFTEKKDRRKEKDTKSDFCII